MNWDAIAAVSETISSIAVIVSLVYLARQIQQSNKLSKGQTRVELRHMASSELASVIEMPDIQISYYKESLTHEEKVRLNAHLVSAMRLREFIWRQHKEGLLDDDTYKTHSMVLLQFLSPPRCRHWWKKSIASGAYDPEFVEYVESVLKNNPEVQIGDIWEEL